MKVIVFIVCILVSQSCFAQQWDSLQGGLNSPVEYMYADSVSDQLYITGHFTVVNHDTVWGIASWNNNRWDSLGHGVDRNGSGSPGSTWAIARYNGLLYAGGNFHSIGYLPDAFGLAIWNGSSWDSIPQGQPNGVIRGMRVINNELYCCGTFNMIGGESANAIAKWNGINWSSIGNNYNFNLNGSVLTDVIEYHNNLYVSGTFDDPNGNLCRLARWDGNSWYFFTASITGGIAMINDMEVYDDKLYVGGLFYSSAGNAGTSIMCWNDTVWNAVGGSVQVGSLNPYPTIKDMCIHNGKLYCAGNFQNIGGVPAIYLASWDGTNWCGYNISWGQAAGIEAMAFHHDTLYAGGGYLELDGDSCNFICRWIGGSYVDTCGFISTNTTEISSANPFQLFPNPATNSLNIVFNQNHFTGEIILFDQLGREVWKRRIDSASPIEINTSGFADGMYFYRISESNQSISAGKFLVQH